MPGKWQTLNGVRYPVDDHSSPRASEEYNPYGDPAFQRRIASLKSDMRGSKKGGTLDDNLYPNHPYNTRKSMGACHGPNHKSVGAPRRLRARGRENLSVPKCMRTRTGTDYRNLRENRAAITIQKHIRGFLSRHSMNLSELPFKGNPSVIYKGHSMLDRWGEGAEMIVTPEEPKCHPVGWTEKNHYSELGWQWCGQSCPCCRARAGDTLGACPICAKQ